jgi:hypothetical protein
MGLPHILKNAAGPCPVDNVIAERPLSTFLSNSDDVMLIAWTERLPLPNAAIHIHLSTGDKGRGWENLVPKRPPIPGNRGGKVWDRK